MLYWEKERDFETMELLAMFYPQIDYPLKDFSGYLHLVAWNIKWFTYMHNLDSNYKY